MLRYSAHVYSCTFSIWRDKIYMIRICICSAKDGTIYLNVDVQNFNIPLFHHHGMPTLFPEYDRFKHGRCASR